MTPQQIREREISAEALANSAVLAPEIQAKLALLAWAHRQRMVAQLGEDNIGIVVMAKNIKHAEALQMAFSRILGCRPVHVHFSEAQRFQYRNQYEAGDYHVFIVVGLFRVGWHTANNCIALPLHPFMPTARYIQFVGRCLKLDKHKYPSLTDAVVIHLDGLNYDSNWSFLLWSAFNGVAPETIDLHRRKQSAAQDDNRNDTEDKEGKEGKDGEYIHDPIYDNVHIYNDMTEDLREYMRLHEEGDWEPLVPEVPTKKRRGGYWRYQQLAYDTGAKVSYVRRAIEAVLRVRHTTSTIASV